MTKRKKGKGFYNPKKGRRTATQSTQDNVETQNDIEASNASDLISGKHKSHNIL